MLYMYSAAPPCSRSVVPDPGPSDYVLNSRVDDRRRQPFVDRRFQPPARFGGFHVAPHRVAHIVAGAAVAPLRSAMFVPCLQGSGPGDIPTFAWDIYKF